MTLPGQGASGPRGTVRTVKCHWKEPKIRWRKQKALGCNRAPQFVASSAGWRPVGGSWRKGLRSWPSGTPQRCGASFALSHAVSYKLCFVLIKAIIYAINQTRVLTSIFWLSPPLHSPAPSPKALPPRGWPCLRQDVVNEAEAWAGGGSRRAQQPLQVAKELRFLPGHYQREMTNQPQEPSKTLRWPGTWPPPPVCTGEIPWFTLAPAFAHLSPPQG